MLYEEAVREGKMADAKRASAILAIMMRSVKDYILASATLYKIDNHMQGTLSLIDARSGA